MTAYQINNYVYWKDCAEECRAKAEAMNTPGCYRAMMKIAEDYEVLAMRAAMRIADEMDARQ